MDNPSAQPNDDIQSRIERLDRLIEEREDGTRGLGVRLALGVAAEMRDGKAPGADTGALVASWVEKFGSEIVDEAVAQARVLLKDPARMAEEFRKRMEPAAGVGRAEEYGDA